MPPIFSASVLLLSCSLTSTAKCKEAPKSVWILQNTDYVCTSKGFASPPWATINREGTHVSKLQLFQAKGRIGNQLAESLSLCLGSFAPRCPEPNSPALICGLSAVLMFLLPAVVVKLCWNNCPSPFVRCRMGEWGRARAGDMGLHGLWTAPKKGKAAN